MRASVLFVAIVLVCSVAAYPEPHSPTYASGGFGGGRPFHGSRPSNGQHGGVRPVPGGVGGGLGGLGGVHGGVESVGGVSPVHGGVGGGLGGLGGGLGGLGGVHGGVGSVGGVRPVHGVGSVHDVVRPVHTGAIGHGSYGK
ncbi:holotricin-3-like [Palaemon carinicauda]|uniref:holotricin-3-like n=1 Tax=Palaemon carinicauda TaxID=392227 RepID=UPI0035B59ED6